MRPKRLLVLGASGMLGNVLFRYFTHRGNFEVFGSVRSARSAALLPSEFRGKLLVGTDVQDLDSLIRLFDECKPDVVFNCVGIVKQLDEANDPIVAIPINSLLPHRLARLASVARARLIHFSTDCVFSGKKGMYVEQDIPDCYDLYGRTKLLGEVDYPDALTLRTSIIGHELDGAHGLLNWFLSQSGDVNGFSKAIFSGFPTVEIARILADFVLPKPDLRGVYQVSSSAISKFDLLKLVAEIYGCKTNIIENDKVVIDRSLDSSRFRSETGYSPPTWHKLVQKMHDFG